jgi:hypothetical protein
MRPEIKAILIGGNCVFVDFSFAFAELKSAEGVL